MQPPNVADFLERGIQDKVKVLDAQLEFVGLEITTQILDPRQILSFVSEVLEQNFFDSIIRFLNIIFAIECK